jgi:cell division transport system permease protein
VFISLVLAFGALVLNELVRINTLAWQEGTHVIAFLKDADAGGLTPELQVGFAQDVETWDQVKPPVRYVDKLGAYDEFQQIFADDPNLIDSIDPTVLPASLRIELNDINEYEAVTARLQVDPAVLKVNSLGPQIERLATLSRVLNVLGLGLALVLGVSAVILISNTIRMAIYARRDEVSIMKLVGASNWYIRIPFLLEGLIEGVLGAVLAVLAVWIPAQNLRGLGESIQLIQLNIPGSFFLLWGVVFVTFGAVAGVIGSLLGLSRYLREADGSTQPVPV